MIDLPGQGIPVDPFAAEDGAPGDKEFPFFPGLDREGRAVFPSPHVLDEILMGDMGMRIDDHRFLPVAIDPSRTLSAEHKEPDSDHDQSDEKKGAEEYEGRGEERAKEVTPVTRCLFGRGHWTPERPETAGRAGGRAAPPAKPVRRIERLSAMAAFGHGRIIGQANRPVKNSIPIASPPILLGWTDKRKPSYQEQFSPALPNFGNKSFQWSLCEQKESIRGKRFSSLQRS